MLPGTGLGARGPGKNAEAGLCRGGSPSLKGTGLKDRMAVACAYQGLLPGTSSCSLGVARLIASRDPQYMAADAL